MDDKFDLEEEKEVIDYDSLGKKMREIRRGRTQQQISEIFHVDRTVYSKYENGKVKPSREFIIKFADYFQVPVDELMKKVSAAIPDTSALLKNIRLLHMLLEDYDQVIIPTAVLRELSYRKNYGKSGKEKKTAWQVLANIDYYMTEYSSRIRKMDSGNDQRKAKDQNMRNDLEIIELARDAAKKTIGDVEIITDDVDIAVHYDKAVQLDAYVAKRTKTFDYQTILDLNLEYDHLEYYKKIIEKMDLNTYLPDGMTLLISCIKKYRLKPDEKPVPRQKIYQKMEFLLANGADPDKNDNGQYCLPPLAHCIQAGYDDAFFLLMDHGCDFNKASRDERTFSHMKAGKLNEGNTPLMIACWCGRKKYVQKLCNMPGISLNQQDSNGYTALIKCAVQRYNRKKNNAKASVYEQLYQYLLERGADPLIRDRNNRTAMDWWKKADELKTEKQG